MAEYKDVMLDLETLGLAPGCVVLSIGAVAFNHENPDRSPVVYQRSPKPEPRPLGPEYHRIIQVRSSVDAGLFVDDDTMAWWARQSPEARKTYTQAQKMRAVGVKKLLPACVEFNKWLSQFGPGVRLWGNGANFDQPILRAAFAAVEVAPVWSPFDERCYRTLKGLVPGPKLERVGTYHNALDDAISQAQHAVKLLRILDGTAKA